MALTTLDNGPKNTDSKADSKPDRKPSIHRERVNLSVDMDNSDFEIAGAIKNLFYKARHARRPLVSQWRKNYNLLRNRTWLEGRPSWLPSPEVPEIYPIVTTMTGWMTDQRPIIDIAPALPQGTDYYSFLSRVAQDLQYSLYSTFTTHKWAAEIEKAIFDGWVYGTGILKTVWDDAVDKGLGNAKLSRVDIFTFYPDPDCTCMEDSNYFIEARTMSLQELDRRFPGAKEAIFESPVQEDVDEAPKRTDSHASLPKANPGAISPATAPRYGLPGQSRIHATEMQGITVFEAWLREHDIVEDNGETFVYDCWRVVVVTGNHVLMNERAEDVWDHGRHPYSRYVAHETGEFWGYAMVELLAPSQLAINRLLAAVQHHVELVGNPVFKEGVRSGLQRTRITNKPGQRVTVNDNSVAEWLEPPNLDQNVTELLRFYIGEMERVSGMSAIHRGEVGKDRKSEDALDKIQDAGFVRIRMALRNLEYCLRDAFTIAASLVVQFYDVPRVVTMLGPSGEQSMRVLQAKNFYLPGKGQDGEDTIPFKYQLVVNAGSEGAISSQQRREDAKILYAMGAIDDEAILDVFNWPNKPETLKRVRGLKEAGLLEPPGKRQRAQRTS